MSSVVAGRMSVLGCDTREEGDPRPFGEGNRRAGEDRAIPGSLGVDLGGSVRRTTFSRLTKRQTENWNELTTGMSADIMRAMFIIYLALIAVGLVGFTLIGLLQR
jgi:hypothetical protein